MVAKINIESNLYGALAYNQEKVDEGLLGKILGTNLVFEPADGKFNITECMNDFMQFVLAHFRTEKPVFHVSLNPHPDDRLTDEQLSDIGREYMQKLGYGDQTYLIFKHEDIGREHIHIKLLATMYHFQSMGEYKAVLSLYSINVEELKGEVKGKLYRGLLCSAVDSEGNKVGNPLKSSIFGKSVGYDELEKRMTKSAERIKTKNLKVHTLKAVSEAKREIGRASCRERV